MEGAPRKRIAVLIGQPEEYSQERFLKGFIRQAFKGDYDVLVFAMYIKYQNTPGRSRGDSSIFELPDYGRFDAVVVCADTIQTPGVAEKIEEDLHDNYKGSVLFVDKESRYFPSIHIENYTPQKKVITHLIEKHGLKDIAFLTGKSWHPHSIIRLNAYKDALKEHGIPVNESRIFYGDFWYTSGQSLADSLISDGGLPQAVACASDCMALGLAKGLTEKGIRVPEDMVVVGFDSNDEGHHAPVPLTSAPLSSELLGRNAAHYADCLIKGIPYEAIVEEPELFIGGTCGCGCDSAKASYYKRDTWDTELSLGTTFSPFNHMDDDMIAQTTFTGLISTIFGSVHLIRGFDSFSICLNPGLGGAEDAFEDRMMQVIRCGRETENNDRILTDALFGKEMMLPELYEDRDKPTVFYLMPLFFNESVFGFAAVGYEDKAAGISQEYRAWLKSVCRGIECYRRSDVLIGSNKIAREGLTTDSLTGLPNYRGFLSNAETLLHLMRNNGGHIGVLTVDIDDLSGINDTFGRKEGDKAIIAAASALEDVFCSRNCLCFRAGNDELVALRITRSPDEFEMLRLKDKLMERLRETTSDTVYELSLYYGIGSGSPGTSEELEKLVNIAISRKNINKADARKLSADDSLTEQEQKDAKTVSSILDDNRMNYFFQPIVDAKTGKIYAYEALMRSDTVPYLEPPVILRYAEFYDRLYDVEKATFSNVLRTMRNNENALSDGKKVFINSIPGCMLNDDDLKMVEEYMTGHPGSVVVELTEHSEMSDDELGRMKQIYERMGIKTAVDDYGTGYSNVSNLLRYLPDYVKIDRALLSGIEVSPQKQHFVREIIEFSHDNGIVALAEGVETEAELNTVIALGADLIQGYYTGRPATDMVQTIDPDVVKKIRDLAASAYKDY
ncbi:MAG: EAL domain-containing protein [Clostridiales bacterium]|nr:EAL domain-containing protein [Clostridiales bacterium]